MIYRCIEALKEKSPNAKIYIFINKMDLLEDSMRNDNFFKIKSYLEKEDIKYNFSCNIYMGHFII